MAIKENTGLALDLNEKARGRLKAAMQSDVSTGSIPTSEGNVNAKFSLKGMDSAGRQLSEQQREYFKDSKVRDADGRLKVMYRGGDETFTVFDRKKSKYSNLYGRRC